MIGCRTILPAAVILVLSTPRVQADVTVRTAEQSGRPTIDPALFTSQVTNPYLTLKARKRMLYEAKTEDGDERVEIYVTAKTRKVMGVDCTIVRERAWIGADLVEYTEDYVAQDDQGNVWYFGESTKEMHGGKVTSTEGSWEAGKKGAAPGIMMPAKPAIGQTMQMEGSPGTAEDHAEVIGVDETITVPFGELTGCVRIRESSPLEPGSAKHRCSCPEVGGLALEADPTSGEEMHLVSVEYDVDPTPDGAFPQAAKPAHKITEEQAKAIALKKVPGKVTEVSIERKFGKLAYVIEVQVKNGPETDVIIDMDTGEVLGTEI